MRVSEAWKCLLEVSTKLLCVRLHLIQQLCAQSGNVTEDAHYFIRYGDGASVTYYIDHLQNMCLNSMALGFVYVYWGLSQIVGVVKQKTQQDFTA